MLFLGKLLKGVVYIKDQISLYISRRRGYSYLSDEEIHGLPSNRHHSTEPSFFQKTYTKITDWIFGRHNRTNIPLYETRTSYIHNFNRRMDRSEIATETPLSPRSSHADTEFENHMNSDMMNSHDFYRSSRSMMNSSLYPPPPPQELMNSSSISIYTQTEENSQNTQNIDTEQSKPFNVEDSNLLLNSQFLTKMLNPFQFQKSEQENKIEESYKYEEKSYEEKEESYKYEEKSYEEKEESEEESDREFKQELLKDSYV